MDTDGEIEVVPSPHGPRALRFEGTFETGRPPGVTHGTPLDSVFAVSILPLASAPGRHEWRLTIDGESRKDRRNGSTVLLRKEG